MLKKLIFLAALSVPCAWAETTVDMDIVWMIEQNDAEAFRHELEVGLDPNARLDDLTLLMIAAQLGHEDIVKDLTAHECIDMHAQDSNGNTALHHAVKYERMPVVKILVYADLPQVNRNGKRSGELLYQMRNNDGRIAAEIAHGLRLFELLENPDLYIQSHPHEFHSIAHWYEHTCPARAAQRARRLETFGQKVNRNYQQVKEVTSRATRTVSNAFNRVYEKTKDVIAPQFFGANGEGATKKAKGNVESRYQKAKNFMAQQYAKAKVVAQKAFGTTKEYAHMGYEKTKDACKAAYAKMKGNR